MADASDTRTGEASAPEPDADQAWKALATTNEWIRHSDAKVGVTLATSGAVGIMLYNLVKGLPDGVCWRAYIGPVVCAGLLVGAVWSCTRALVPRTSPSDLVETPATLDEPSPLFYGSIATRWKREEYMRVLSELTAKPTDLVAAIAAQVHVNSDIANKKFYWANMAIKTLLLSVAFLAVTAVRVLMET